MLEKRTLYKHVNQSKELSPIMLKQLVQLLTFQELVILFSPITFIVKIFYRLKRNRGSVKTVIQAKTTLKKNENIPHNLSENQWP